MGWWVWITLRFLFRGRYLRLSFRIFKNIMNISLNSMKHWQQFLLFMTVCSCHVTYAFQSECTLYICLNVKELLARSRREIWRWSDCNWTRTQNHLILKRTLNHLAKLLLFMFYINRFNNELVFKIKNGYEPELKTPEPIIKIGLLPSKKLFFICFSDSPSMMKKNFYFILKTLSILKIFKFLSWLFGHVRKTALLEK